MIISSGETIYLAEVEQALAGHPAVADCAVIGVPDEQRGEVGRAVVVLGPGHDTGPQTAAAPLGHLDGRLARFYRIPTSAVFADVLPRNGAGKVVKEGMHRVHCSATVARMAVAAASSCGSASSNGNDSPGAAGSRPTDAR